MNWKHFLAKLTSIALIFSGLYQTLFSINTILFIYPHLDFNSRDAPVLQEGLIEKALILYFSMVLSSIYGVILLFKPSEKVKFFHILTGILIFVGTLFFVTRTPFTTDPILEFFDNSILKR